MRVNYTLTPTLSIQIVRGAVCLGRSSTPTTRSWSTAARRNTTIAISRTRYRGNADFNIRSFRTTNVVRWEYKPGSSLFVVWQQNRSGYRGVRQTSTSPATSAASFACRAHNVFLVKMSYWLNM